MRSAVLCGESSGMLGLRGLTVKLMRRLKEIFLAADLYFRVREDRRQTRRDSTRHDSPLQRA